MMSDCRHHSSEEAFRPIGARRYRNRPCGMRNVVNLLDLSSSASWKYPCTASSLQNSLASGGIASMISRVEGKGCVGLRTYLLSPVKSVTRRTRRPSALGTKKAGLHHVVASSTGVMTPRSINRSRPRVIERLLQFRFKLPRLKHSEKYSEQQKS